MAGILFTDEKDHCNSPAVNRNDLTYAFPRMLNAGFPGFLAMEKRTLASAYTCTDIIERYVFSCVPYNYWIPRTRRVLTLCMMHGKISLSLEFKWHGWHGCFSRCPTLDMTRGRGKFNLIYTGVPTW